MQNPIMQNLTQNRITNALGNVKGMFNALKSAGNPQMMLQQMMSQNPQLQEAMKLVEQNGGDAKSVFYKLAEEKGVDPNSILQNLM